LSSRPGRDDEAQLAFSRRFGPLEVTKVGSQGTGTNLVILSTIDENGRVVPADHRLALRNKANQLWHTDSTFKRVQRWPRHCRRVSSPRKAARLNTSRPASPGSSSTRRCASA